MRNVLFVVLFWLAACSGNASNDYGLYQKPKDFQPTGTVDAEMQGYLNEYNAEAAKRHVKAVYSKIVEVNWVPDLSFNNDPLWGLCQTYFNPDGTTVSSVTVSSHLNTDMPACVKKLVIFHEFSHGLLGVKHTTHDAANVLEIMYWSSGLEQMQNCTDQGNYINWDAYLDFMFKDQQLEQTD